MPSKPLTLLGIFLALGIIAITAWRFFTPTPPAERALNAPILFSPTAPVVMSDDPRLGASQPKYTIVEFADFECPACRETSQALRELLQKRSDVTVIWKDAPDPEHSSAFSAAVAARCAQAQGKFWEYHDALFEELSLFGTDYSAIAKRLGLDVQKFADCQGDEAVARRVQASFSQALALSVSGTPEIFVNGKAYGTLTTLTELEKALQ